MGFFREERRAAGRRILRGLRTLQRRLSPQGEASMEELCIRRALVIRPFFMGDVVLCLPVAQALKRRWPGVRVSWLLRQEWRGLLDGHSVVDETIPFSPGAMHSSRAMGEFHRVTRELRARDFDLVVNLAWDRSDILWTRLSGAPMRLGIEEYGRPRLLSLLHTATVMAPERATDQRHMVDFYFEPMRLISPVARGENPRLWPTEEEKQVVALRLGSLNLEKGMVVVHPGGRLGRKRWPTARFAELLRELGSHSACAWVLVCGPGEEAWAADLAAWLPPGRGLFWPGPSFGELMALAARSRLMIGNDSGPMHVAAAVGTRVLALFGGDPVRWAPLGEGHRIIRPEQGGLEALEVAPVLDAARQMLSGTV